MLLQQSRQLLRQPHRLQRRTLSRAPPRLHQLQLLALQRLEQPCQLVTEADPATEVVLVVVGAVDRAIVAEVDLVADFEADHVVEEVGRVVGIRAAADPLIDHLL